MGGNGSREPTFFEFLPVEEQESTLDSQNRVMELAPA